MVVCWCASASITSSGTFRYAVYCILSRRSRSYVLARCQYMAFTDVSRIDAEDTPLYGRTVDAAPSSTRRHHLCRLSETAVLVTGRAGLSPSRKVDMRWRP